MAAGRGAHGEGVVASPPRPREGARRWPTPTSRVPQEPERVVVALSRRPRRDRFRRQDLVRWACPEHPLGGREIPPRLTTAPVHTTAVSDHTWLAVAPDDEQARGSSLLLLDETS